jgi:hypothetical protein
MKNHVVVILACFFFLLTSFLWNNKEVIRGHKFIPSNGGGAAPGKTGAPGEGNCTQCHSGAVQDGTAENVLLITQGGVPVSNYTPGQQYNVNLSMVSNPVKRGFQATALNSSNLMAGSFTGVAGNTAINGSTKKYANHTSTSNTSAATPSWNWTWTAPAAGTGDVTFYIATNKTNNNGNDNGDMIYLSQFVVQESSGASLLEESATDIELLSATADKIRLTATMGAKQINGISLHDATGKLLLFSPVVHAEGGVFTIELPKNKAKGTCFLTFQITHNIVSKKIYIQ